MKKIPVSGKVYLVGAGPGDPELLTLKAVKYLQQADVVLTDRLVGEDIILEHVRDEAEIIYVGKQCRKGNSTAQTTINDLLVLHAVQGRQVVRLKGGDVSIFSNIMDELETLVKAGIPYEIVPGITAATGAAAYSGIPLTARDHSTAVRFLTSYQSDFLGAAYWKELAATEDTLVFYMSSETIKDVVLNLTINQIDEEKLIAVVEQATTPFQRVYVSNLYHFQEALGERKFISPSLIIVGKVVQLHEQFKWITTEPFEGEYFKAAAPALEQGRKIKRA